MKFEPDIIDVVVFDVDGTLYDKNREYVKEAGSIQTAHDFFRFCAFDSLESGQTAEFVEKNLVKEYKARVEQRTLEEAIASVSLDVKERYLSLKDNYGSNGKVFASEFDGAGSSFLHRMLSHIDFGSTLCEDERLQDTINYLKQEGYELGMLTTEVYGTAESVCESLGLDITDFFMGTGNEYHILCGENVEEKKPSSEGFEKLIDIYQNPKSIVYVGDSLTKDVKAPLRCGLQAIHVLNSQDTGVELAETEIDGETHQYKEIGNVYLLEEFL